MMKKLLTLLCIASPLLAAKQIPWIMENKSDVPWVKFVLWRDRSERHAKDGELHALHSLTIKKGESKKLFFYGDDKWECWQGIKVYKLSAHPDRYNDHKKDGKKLPPLPQLLKQQIFSSLGICPPATATITLSGKNGQYAITIKAHKNL